MDKAVIIAGKTIPMRLKNRSELKGVFTDALLMFSFYDIEYMGVQFVVLESKTPAHLTPVQCKKLTSNLSAVLGRPCVIMFNQLASYERNRYIEQGVYFVVSGKYVFLPFFLINARDSAPINKERLQPAAQYLLLYHLQRKSLEGCTLSDMEKLLPYNYLAISRAVRQLKATYLVDVEVSNNGRPYVAPAPDSPTGTGLRVIRQTLLLLNMQNDVPMTFTLRPAAGDDGCTTQACLFVPDGYRFDLPALCNGSESRGGAQPSSSTKTKRNKRKWLPYRK